MQSLQLTGIVVVQRSEGRVFEPPLYQYIILSNVFKYKCKKTAKFKANDYVCEVQHFSSVCHRLPSNYFIRRHLEQRATSHKLLFPSDLLICKFLILSEIQSLNASPQVLSFYENLNTVEIHLSHFSLYYIAVANSFSLYIIVKIINNLQFHLCETFQN